MLVGDQLAAEESFEEFLDGDGVTFGLFGLAGCGKSFMTAHFIRNYMLGSATLLAAPTHKAAHVMRRFLRNAGVPYGATIDDYPRLPLVGTTAQLLGILPEVSDDQDSSKMNFKRSARGLIERVSDLDWIIVDEVSMLSYAQFRMIRDMAKDRGARVLVVGDPGQLPPVDAGPIPFEKFVTCAHLTQVRRTSDDTGITTLAHAVRNGEKWRSVRGSGIDHVADAAGAFIQDLGSPPSEDESSWSVYVAYRNVAVNAVNEAACQKLYGHGRSDIREGEVVLATNSISTFMAGVGRVPLCTNGEGLIIEQLGRRGRWGVNIAVRSLATGEEFIAEYLSDAERTDRDHPYNVELEKRRAKAQALQKGELEGTEADRKGAWISYFNLRDNTILSVAHPFALTSHKSQGSTYARAFVDASDMAPFDPRALYVGVTRPSQQLIIG